jgi:hypothetical protein
MKNNRVYLAKTTLARGLDVQYVKSNLLRIPGIEIVGFGSGFKPNECGCVVVVGSYDSDGTMPLSPNVLAVLHQFSEVDNVFVFSGLGDSDCVEQIKPLCSRIDFWEESGLKIDGDSLCLLNNVSALANIRKDLWKPISKFHVPKKKYALPPLPSVDERRSNKVAKSHKKGDQELSPKDDKNPPLREFGKGTPLLRKRRR